MSKQCYIVGGGPSLKGFDWNLLNDKFVIAVNRAYEVLPNANIIYFTDQDFWDRHKVHLKSHSGKLIRGTLKLGRTKDPQVQEYKLTGANGIDTTPGCLKHGSNSVYAAINLALFHLDFDTVYLLGVDMKWNGVESHWHTGHPRIDPEQVYENMKGCYGTMANALKSYPKKTVINVNTDSALKCFEQRSVQQVFT